MRPWSRASTRRPSCAGLPEADACRHPGPLLYSSIFLLYPATRTLGVLLFWRLLRERVVLVLLVAAKAILALAHPPHLILLFRLL